MRTFYRHHLAQMPLKNHFGSIKTPRTAPTELAKALNVSTSGMGIQEQRLLVISQNLANASSKSPSRGVDPYRRKVISFKNVFDREKGVELVAVKKIAPDQTEFQTKYDPGDPAADKNGNVKYTNVNRMMEMADMREASKTHLANLRAYEKSLSMIQSVIGLMKP